MNNNQDSNNNKTPSFSTLVNCLRRINQAKSSDKKAYLQRYIEDWRKVGFGSFYPAMRLLVPHLDSERAYDLKEVRLANAYIRAFSLTRSSPDAQRLVNWTKPKFTGRKWGSVQAVGDFASIAAEVISVRSVVTKSKGLSIDFVNENLRELSDAASFDEAVKVIKGFLNNYTAEEQKWLIKIILKDLKVGLSEDSILAVYHPDARNVFNRCNNLQKVTDELTDPHKRVTNFEITLFNPIRPMLAKRLDIGEIPKALGGKTFWMEEKLDGERIQLHKAGDKFAYYSRRAIDYTHLYGESKDEGSLTPYIYNLFNHTDSCILDGEMLAYNPIYDAFMQFGTLKTAASDMFDDPEKPRPCFVVFDVILLNNKPLNKQKYSKRREILNRMINPLRGHLQLMPYKEGKDKKDLLKALESSIQDGQEGFIVKNPESPYQFDTRCSDWIKLKADYFDGLSDSLDLLIIGGSYGKGKRANMVGTFMCGLRVPTEDGTPKFQAFCRVGSGFTLVQQKEFHEAHNWVHYDAKNCPSWITIGKDKPDVIVQVPTTAKVVEVRASEIIQATQYPSSLTLRFPRFIKTRDDKDWTMVMTVEEMYELKKIGLQRPPTLTEDSPPESSKKTVALRKRQKMLQFTLQSSIEVVDQPLFENMTFYVFRHACKTKVEEVIRREGGRILGTAKNNGEPFHIIAITQDLALKSLANKEPVDIISSSWIADCVGNRKLLPLTPLYYIYMKPETKLKVYRDYDKYGDSYTEDVTPTGLQVMLKHVDTGSIEENDFMSLLKDFEYRYCPAQHIFKDVVAYIANNTMSEDIKLRETITDYNLKYDWDKWYRCTNAYHRLSIAERILKYYGVQIAPKPSDARVTHVIISRFDTKDVPSIKNDVGSSHSTLCEFVYDDWVYESHKHGVRLDCKVFDYFENLKKESSEQDNSDIWQSFFQE